MIFFKFDEILVVKNTLYKLLFLFNPFLFFVPFLFTPSTINRDESNVGFFLLLQEGKKTLSRTRRSKASSQAKSWWWRERAGELVGSEDQIPNKKVRNSAGK